ncbi:hypothetical protein SDC9_69970 [bioreactor metagenome]|uniref:Uncharacterized protein n=1 Tax=bioreactor metagenome TaxID=1076179 RepID=A0A644Y4L6_9ZZZZ
MPDPAILHFLCHSYNHIGIDLSGRGKTFRLNDFKVNGNMSPVVIKRLICHISVHQRNRFKTGKNVIRKSLFRLRCIDFTHFAN